MHRNGTQETANSSQNAAYMLMSVRRLCKLRRPDVATAASQIAELLGPEFAIPVSRLADIEGGRVAPTFCGLSSLCAIYGVEMPQMLQWYRIQPRLEAAA